MGTIAHLELHQPNVRSWEIRKEQALAVSFSLAALATAVALLATVYFAFKAASFFFGIVSVQILAIPFLYLQTKADSHRDRWILLDEIDKKKPTTLSEARTVHDELLIKKIKEELTKLDNRTVDLKSISAVWLPTFSNLKQKITSLISQLQPENQPALQTSLQEKLDTFSQRIATLL
jgi:hypothetical protein